MSSQTLPIILVVMLFLAGVYATYSKRSKIYCSFENSDGTVEFKWVSNKDEFVYHRGYKFDVISERIQTVWVHNGIHQLFPTKASYLAYNHASAYPRDFRNQGRTVLNPKVRKIIDKAATLESYMRTSSGVASKKQGLLQQYLPMILVVVMIIGGYFLYSQINSVKTVINIMQNQINTMLPR